MIVVLLLALFASGLAMWLAHGVPSRLPDFDEAEYSSYRADALPIRWSGDRARELRSIFERISRDRNPEKWAVRGSLKLYKNGRQIGEVDVFAPSGGKGPFRVGKNYFLGYDPTEFRAFLKKNAD